MISRDIVYFQESGQIIFKINESRYKQCGAIPHFFHHAKSVKKTEER